MPGIYQKTGRPFKTCCRSCAVSSCAHHDAACDSRNGIGGVVLIRILDGTLTKNFSAFGQMDPFVKVFWKTPGGRKLIAVTPVSWAGHMTPVWNYTCIGQPLDRAGNPVLEFEVYERQFGDFGHTFCGAAYKSVDEFLPARPKGGRSSFSTSSTQKLTLRSNDGEQTGDLNVQCMELPREGIDSSACKGDLTEAKLEHFEHPVHRLTVSGGTAVFFKLLLTEKARTAALGPTSPAPREPRSATYFVGKDLSQAAQDEVLFYEYLLKVNRNEDHLGLKGLLRFAFEYLGILNATDADSTGDITTRSSSKVSSPSAAGTAAASTTSTSAVAASSSAAAASAAAASSAAAPAGATPSSPSSSGALLRGGTGGSDKVELLVLRNLFDGCEKLRMLDIKIGEKTASPGWKGKSSVRALYQQFRDNFTNSACEGFRLAGFNGAPESFSSQDPLLDVPGATPAYAKKARRIMFSMMPGASMFEYFLDTQDYNEAVKGKNPRDTLMAAEVFEITLHEMLVRLLELACACRHVDIPQKFVGSSIGLAFDVGKARPRVGGEKSAREACRVHIFDWGRSEINTFETHKSLSEAEQHNRDLYWRYYVGGVDRLTWEAARTYYHHFCNPGSWGKSVQVTIYDFDSLKSDDFLGSLEVELTPTNGKKTEKLQHGSSSSSCTGSPEATLTYSVECVKFPSGGRLRETWRITLHEAKNLPIADVSARKSDPYAIITATSTDKKYSFEQRTGVKVGELNPAWEDTFDLPIASEGGRLEEALLIGACRARTAAGCSMSELQEVSNDITPGASHSVSPPTLWPAVRTSGGDKSEDETAALQMVDYLDGVGGSSAGVHRERSGAGAWKGAAKLMDPLGAMRAGFQAASDRVSSAFR
eukprot:CAMPEP_0206532196 /NCGR_PEP_ID=MMETSP0325_2-20121206/4216_1 /ASSEMBLY_ACC=CAM_ASM_000347 /TAXON_ID=2866 /ORGANISM="Crypthecodinium cohnii, Strain Seligo" /LENGTH=875 /DNA_ID=CAMNT_0054028583 /DNA_START=535 /DNA_END=3162 /DNA_ORIENTATION=+